MSVTVNIGRTSSEKRQLDKDVTTVKSVSGSLRNDSNIVNPVILVEASAESIATCNYMEIGDFGRKYFITDIKAVSNQLALVSGHVDVLSTYKSQIRKNQAILGRSESNWNLYLNDGSFKVTNKTQVITKKFSGKFSDNSSLILVTVG